MIAIKELMFTRTSALLLAKKLLVSLRSKQIAISVNHEVNR